MSFIDDNAVSHLRLSCNCIDKCSSSLSVTRMRNFCSLLALPSSKTLARHGHSILSAYLILYIGVQHHSGVTVLLGTYHNPPLITTTWGALQLNTVAEGRKYVLDREVHRRISNGNSNENSDPQMLVQRRKGDLRPCSSV